MLLLHISDIHFHRDEIGSTMDPNHHLRNEILRDVEQMCNRLGKVPTAILITGDIAYAARKEEYTFALRWLEQLVARCGASMSSIFVIPGNHDVNRSTAGGITVQSLHLRIKNCSLSMLDREMRICLSDANAGRTLYEPLTEFNLFAGQFFCDLIAPDRTFCSRDLPLNDGSVLRLTGLNSAFLSSESDAAGELFVDPSYYRIIREAGVEHLVLCHHPVNWLKNEASLKNHLNDVARVQLYGHEHTNRIESSNHHVTVFASAAHPDRTENGWEPGYNLMEIEVVTTEETRKLSVRTHVRVWQLSPGQFRAKMNGYEDSFHQNIKLENWIANHATNVIDPINVQESCSQSVLESHTAEDDPMDTLRNIYIKFFKLTFSQKTAIAGKLGLFEDSDLNQPDSERFRRIFFRAQERNLIEALDKEVNSATQTNN